MEWTNNLSVSNLFLTHQVELTCDDGVFQIHIPSVRELQTDDDYYRLLQFFNDEQQEDLKKIFKKQFDLYQILQLLMCTAEITNIQEFATVSSFLHRALPKILPDFTIKERQLYVGDCALTYNVLLEIIYILRLGCGFKVEKPQHFGPGEEAARLFYERAQAAQRKAHKIKQEYNNNKDVDTLMQMFVLISYRFPIYTFEQLYDLTMMQLHYLQEKASAILSYEHGMTAYLAGNLKKPPKFFLN